MKNQENVHVLRKYALQQKNTMNELTFSNSSEKSMCVRACVYTCKESDKANWAKRKQLVNLSEVRM